MGSGCLIAGTGRSWLWPSAAHDGSQAALRTRTNPLFLLLTPTNTFGHKSQGRSARIGRLRLRRQRSLAVVAAQQPPQQAELNVSVLRFTFGIPGFDESYLPRYIGLASGLLIVLNHFVSDASATSAQLRSEALGICLAAFSTALPYFGRFLKGANPVDRTSLPEGNKQLFILSEDVPVSQKEDLAWASYALLRNTNTMSVLIAVDSVLCARGYWDAPEDFSREQLVEWFKTQIPQTGFLDLKDALYLPQISATDSKLGIVLPKGAVSVLVQPVFGTSDQATYSGSMITGFVLLISSSKYAYGEKDRAWIRAVSNKLPYENEVQDSCSIGTSL